MPLLLSRKTKEDTGGDGSADLAGYCAGRERNRKIFASASAGLVQRGAQVASTLLLMPLLLRALGPAQFGIWGAAASLAWLAGFLDVGTGAALVSLVARSMAANQVEEARRQIAGALSFGCGVAGLIGMGVLGAFVLEIPQVRFGPYLIAIIGLAVNIPLNIANNVWMALQKGYFAGCWELMQTLLTVAGLAAATTQTRDVGIYVAIVYAALVISNLGSLVHLLVRYPKLRPGRLMVSLAAARLAAGEGLMYFLLGLTGTLAFSLDNVLALALLGPEASARMTIALRMCVTALGAIGVASQPLWPAFSEAVASRHWDWIKKSAIWGSSILLGMTVCGSAVLLVYGERFLTSWLHGHLEISQGLLWAIAAWAFAQALSRVPALLLNGLSIVRYQVLISGVVVALSFVLKFVLSSRFGVAGILWGTTATVLVVTLPAQATRILTWIKSEQPG